MINKAILIGNVGKDPDVRTTATNKKVAKFSLATSEKRKDAEGYNLMALYCRMG